MLASLAQLAVAVEFAALAPVPDKVVLETKSFGTVTLDHAAHLRERASCKKCHGSGPTTKLQQQWTPRQAHDICVACHKEQKRGPTGCRQCHVVKPEPQPALIEGEPAKGDAATAVAGTPSQRVASATTAEALSSSSSSAGAGSPAPLVLGSPGVGTVGAPAGTALPAFPDATESRPGAFARIAQVGLSMTGSSGANGAGPSFRFSARDERFVLEESVDWVGWRSGRIYALAGGGMVFPFRANRWTATALVVGGVDAVLPLGAARPALGLRGGVEWLTRLRGMNVIGVSLTALLDLTDAGDSPTQQAGQASISLTTWVGFGLPDLP